MGLANGYLNVINKFSPQRLHYAEVAENGKLKDTDAKTPNQRRKKMDDLTESNKNKLNKQLIDFLEPDASGIVVLSPENFLNVKYNNNFQILQNTIDSLGNLSAKVKKYFKKGAIFERPNYQLV